MNREPRPTSDCRDRMVQKPAGMVNNAQAQAKPLGAVAFSVFNLKKLIKNALMTPRWNTHITVLHLDAGMLAVG